MTDREVFLATLRGEKHDRVVFTPRLDIWYNYKKATGTLPEEYRDIGINGLQRALGVGMSARKGKIFNVTFENSNVTVTEDGCGGYTNTIENSAGRISERFATAMNDHGAAIKPERVEHYLKSEKDYAVMKEHIKGMRFTPCFEKFEEYDRAVGDAMLPLAIVGDIPVMMVLRDYVGYNECYFHLADFPEVVEDLIDEYERALIPMQELMIKSPAKLFLHGMHFDSQTTPPPIFRKYVVPYYKRLMPKIRAAGKFVAIHQDGDANQLLEPIKEAGVQAADCLCTKPMAKLDLQRAFEVWGKDVTIWGGIPSVILNPDSYSEQEFLKYAEQAVEVAEKGNVILSVSDNVMPEADLNRLKTVADMIRRKG